MNDDDAPRFTVEDPRARRSSAPAGGDLLPPVEPPSAGFIIQLFVVPALIVLLIVGLWLAFNWLVRAASSPHDVIQGLESGPSVARWQRASELADMLRNKRFAAFKRDGKSADDLARILDREILAARMDENSVEFRKYLALALGEFEVQEGADVLLKASETKRDPAEQAVRHSAIEAIAVRSFNLAKRDPPQLLMHADLEPTLFRLAGDEDPFMRRRVAFALGQMGTPAAIERLETILDDPDPHTCYNATVALAHRGNVRSIETLVEMLDLEEHAAAPAAKEDPSVVHERSVIFHTAVEAALALARQNPGADLAPVIDALNQVVDAEKTELVKAHLLPQAQFDAKRALKTLQTKTIEQKAK
jgi:HEAT repeat protein